MSKSDSDNENVEMVTFQPYEEEVISTANLKNGLKADDVKKPVSQDKAPKKTDALKGILLGVLIAALFIVYDLFMH